MKTLSTAFLHTSLKPALRRAVQTLRLMVGVGDYEGYLDHMRRSHPEQEAMTQTEYFRYCQSARYPSKDGAIKRCPC